MAEESLSQHISRKELKKDEIRETLAHGAEAVFSHQKIAGLVLGAALVVALAILGWRFYAERQTGKASAALEEAMKIFQARIRAPGEPGEPGDQLRKSNPQEATKVYNQIRKDFPDSPVAEEAEKRLETFGPKS